MKNVYGKKEAMLHSAIDILNGHHPFDDVVVEFSGTRCKIFACHLAQLLQSQAQLYGAMQLYSTRHVGDSVSAVRAP